VVIVKPGRGLWLAQRRERRPDLLSEQSGLFPGGEVAALGGLVEVGEVGVDLLGPATRGLDDLTGEHGEADRELQFGGFFPDAMRAARLRDCSQYSRAEEVAVPVSQYKVMLSRM